MRRLAHISDLHLGESVQRARCAAQLVDALQDADVDHVVLTGDVTHSGRIDEYELFLALFRPLLDRRQLTVVPGNHDRGHENVAELLSDELRVSVDAREGLFMVCVDSTAPHNAVSFRSHGELCDQMLDAVDEALALAPRGTLSCVLLHHHVLPLPIEGVGEWFAHVFGWPHAAELPLGRELLLRVRGRCDLVLHGHKHLAATRVLVGERRLQVVNAGSTTQLGAFRVFEHDAGRVTRERWVSLRAQRSAVA